MRVLVFIVLMFTWALSSNGQDKPPVAVDDTVYFPVMYEFYPEDFYIYPLSNDFSQEMHPIEIGACSYSGSIVYDTVISIYGLQINEDLIISYRIRDKINNLVSEPGYIHIIATTESYAWLDINNINARINATSNHFSRYDQYYNYSFFECPRNGGNYTFSNFKLWIAGIDESDKLHFAPSYRMQWPYLHSYRSGPISVQYHDQIDDPWDRVWDIQQSDIDYHLYDFQSPDYIIPETVLNWPANGDTSNGQLWEIAPFVDLDQDGIYEPFEGDYPIIKGDQAIYFISNDDRGIHAHDSLFFGVEIHGMAYAFECPDDSAFQNSMFIDYLLINRSENSYHDVYVGINAKLGIGSPYDDYTGCDTLLNAFYSYNALIQDSNGWSDGYGYSPPAQAVSFLNQPLNYFKTYYRYTYSSIGKPREPMEYYNQLQGMWNDGTSVTYGGIGYGGNRPFNYQHSGNPQDPDAWSMVSAHLDPYMLDKSVGSTGPFTMDPGDTISLELAILFARDYGGDNLSSVTLLLDRLKKLRAFYFNDSIPCEELIHIEEKMNEDDNILHIFPNPSSLEIYCRMSVVDCLSAGASAKAGRFSMFIYDMYGKNQEEIPIPKGQEQLRIDVSNYPAGIYIAVLKNKKGIVGQSKFVVR